MLDYNKIKVYETVFSDYETGTANFISHLKSVEVSRLRGKCNATSLQTYQASVMRYAVDPDG